MFQSQVTFQIKNKNWLQIQSVYFIVILFFYLQKLLIESSDFWTRDWWQNIMLQTTNTEKYITSGLGTDAENQYM